MSEYETIRRAVIKSFMWSLAFELNKSVGNDERLSIFQKIAAMQSVSSIVKIMLNECRKISKIDNVEAIKMEAWDELAKRYAEHEVVLNIPTAIEELFFINYDWMSQIKNLEHNINRAVRLSTDETVKPKVSRIVTDEYNDILSKVIYKYMKDGK